MNWEKGLNRLTLTISIIAFLVTVIISSVYYYNETKKRLPRMLESLNNYRSWLKEEETIFSDKSLLSEENKRKKEYGLPSVSGCISLWKKEISKAKQ